ncbi:MAG TPA: tetratricopeptide repeat protein [Isosphaeraceae bacterium]|nr:tetratricopeptide repeat protein [Isosphaeraceae bacterium]
MIPQIRASSDRRSPLLRALPVLPAFVAALALTCQGGTQAVAGWVGQRVVEKSADTTLVINHQVVARGNVHRIYRVEHTSGDWLWITSGGISGWVRSNDVIPFEQAIDFFTYEIRSNPSAWAFCARGIIWDDRQEFDIAIADFNDALRLDPSDPLAYLNRGIAWSNKHDFDRAISDFNEALRFSPRDAVIYYNRGTARGFKQDYDHAIADFSEAIRLNPRYDAAFSNRGSAWTNKREYAHAVADFNEAIRLDPRNAVAYSNRGLAFSRQRSYARALTDYNEAIHRDPSDALSYNNRAWLLATCPASAFRDGKQAVSSAQRACELADGTPSYTLGTLAAAYAELGDFESAVNWQTKAIALAPEDEKDDYRARLKLYQDKKPYRDEQPGS